MRSLPSRSKTWLLASVAGASLLLASAAQAQSVALTGVLGSKALLVIDNSAPRALAANESAQGVQVVSVGKDEVLVSIKGKTHTVRLGAAPVSVGGGAAPANGTKVVLTADNLGHFNGTGLINGKPMNYMVDTGASTVALSRADAERMGINYQQGQPVNMSTANGVTQGWLVKLNSVRIGDVTVYGIAAVITPQPMPHVLLGNSLLNGFQMTRQGGQMVLEKR